MYSLDSHQEKFDKKTFKSDVYLALKIPSSKCYKNENFENFEKNENWIKIRILELNTFS